MKIKSEIIFTATMGDNIDGFISEAIRHITKHHIKKCLINFNDWYYVYDSKHAQVVDYIINLCYKYTNRRSER